MFGKNIRYLRKKRDMSQADLAKYLGYNTSVTIHRWETGENSPPLNSVASCARLFGVTVDDLTTVDLERRDVDMLTKVSNVSTAAALYKTNVSQRTLDDFVSLSERVLIRRYGDMKLSDIKPYHLQEILNEQRGMSSSQVNSVFHVLRFVFSKAYANDLVTRDASTSLTKPTARKKKTRRALTKDERAAVLAVCESDKYLLFALMIYCGCRPDEAASAKGEDVQVIDGFDVLHVRGTKTALSDRFVPLPIDLSFRIKKTRKSDYIAPYDDGTKLDKFRRRRLWRQFVRDVNIQMGCKTYNGEPVPPLLFDDVVPYCLRHEYCTECARRGVDIRVTQRLMGHASIRMTANVYTNLTNSDVLDACRALEKVQQSVQQSRLFIAIKKTTTHEAPPSILYACLCNCLA